MNARERKLTNFTCPHSGMKNGTYDIHFAYYMGGEWTGESETVSLTEQGLYDLLKPVLITQPVVQRRKAQGRYTYAGGDQV